jgi:hypothetical protein
MPKKRIGGSLSDDDLAEGGALLKFHIHDRLGKPVSHKIVISPRLTFRGEPEVGIKEAYPAHDIVVSPIVSQGGRLHLDTEMNVINFKKPMKISMGKRKREFNGILYVYDKHLKDTSLIITNFLDRVRSWGYLVRPYTPDVDKEAIQRIGINFKHDPENKTLITNAFPEKEKRFLLEKGLLKEIIAPGIKYGNGLEWGGVACGYVSMKAKSSAINSIIKKIRALRG